MVMTLAMAGGASTVAMAQPISLPTYNVAPSTVTIAGISSGGFMAVQMHVAFSSRIHGAAIFAGGPYGCAQGSPSTAVAACASGSGLTPQPFIAYTNSQASAGTIDPTSNLANEPVYLFSGTRDATVQQAVMDTLQQYYQAFSVSNLIYDNGTQAGHGWISPDGPVVCDFTSSPYINHCGIDPEQTFLSQFYGTLNSKNAGALGGTYLHFDQSPFCLGGSCASLSLDDSGWAYVPASCASGAACRLLVVLHGCLQSQSLVGQELVQQSGVNEWADSNDLIVLYPQTVTSSSNIEGCWDWWGYTGLNYALQSGPQMQSLVAMIDRVTGQGVVATATTSGGTGGGVSAGATGGGTADASSSAGNGGNSGPSSAGTATASTGTQSSAANAATGTGGNTGNATATSGSSGGVPVGSTGGAPAAALMLTAISPAIGSSKVPTVVALSGTGFQPGTRALVGTTPLMATAVQSPTVLSGTAPSGMQKGRYDVTVIDPAGATAILRQAFTVVDAGGGGCSVGSGVVPLGLLVAAVFGGLSKVLGRKPLR